MNLREPWIQIDGRTAGIIFPNQPGWSDHFNGYSFGESGQPGNRVLFIKDGEVFHQIYRGDSTNEQLYQKISDTLTILATGGEGR